MSDFHRRSVHLSLVLAAGAGLVACASWNGATHRMVGVVKPYKMDVVQGNVVTKEQVAVLKPGMSRTQVRDILGTPLLASVFHADRWDYVFTFRRQGVEPQARRVTVFFKGNVLERFEADPLPTEAEFAATLDSGRKAADKVPVLEASEESLLQFPLPAKSSGQKALPPLPATYPPLEPAGR